MSEETRKKLLNTKNLLENLKDNALDALPDIFIGQEKILEKINTLIDKANKSNKPLPHLLFVGEEGAGKETLTKIIAKKLNAKITITYGASIELAGDFIGIVTNLKERDVLLIKDIDGLPIVVKEFLYPAMESCQIDFVIDKGPYAKTIKFNLKPFTLIGTTSNPKKLGDKLINLFYSVYNFSPYVGDNLLQIIQNKAKAKGINIDKETSKYFADKLGLTTKKTLFIDKVIAFTTISDSKTITKEIIQEFLSTIETSEEPIEEDNRRSIPNKVRTEVWRRDEGKCTKCGSRENLEYDHIIPVSKGGSNTTRNIELLCEKCNREKRGNIGNE